MMVAGLSKVVGRRGLGKKKKQRETVAYRESEENTNIKTYNKEKKKKKKKKPQLMGTRAAIARIYTLSRDRMLGKREVGKNAADHRRRPHALKKPCERGNQGKLKE